MKRAIAFILTMCLIISFIGCSAQREKSLSFGDTITIENFQLTLKDVDFTKIVNNTKGAEPINAYDRFLLSDGKTLTSVAEKGQIYVVFSFDLQFIGKERTLISPFKNVVLDYDSYKFDLKGAYLNSSNGWKELVFQEGTGYTDTLFEFKPMDETVYDCRCYFKVSDKILASSPFKLSLLFDNDCLYDIDVNYQKTMPTEEEIKKMANIFGGDGGDGNINWTEGSFPFFIENRENFELLIADQLSTAILGLWNVRSYQDDNPKETDTMEFNNDGTIKLSLAEWTYRTSEDGLTLNRLKLGSYTYEVRRPTNDILVLYGTSGNEFYYPYYLLIKK